MLTTEKSAEQHFPDSYVKKIKEIEFSAGAYLLKFALKQKITDEKFIMHIWHSNATEYLEKVENRKVPEKVNLMMPIISNLDPSTATVGHQLIIAGSFPVVEPDGDAWRHSVISSVKDIFPDIEDQVLFIEETKPETVDKLMGENGAVIGMSQTVDQVGNKRLKQQTPIDSLYIVGAEAGGGGENRNRIGGYECTGVKRYSGIVIFSMLPHLLDANVGGNQLSGSLLSDSDHEAFLVKRLEFSTQK